MERFLYLFDELHVLVEVSGPDRGDQHWPVGVPQQQSVGADDGRVQVVWPCLVEDEGNAVDGVADVVNKRLQLQDAEGPVVENIPHHFSNCPDCSFRHSVGGVVAGGNHGYPDPAFLMLVLQPDGQVDV